MNTKQKLPSDALKGHTHPGKIAALVGAAVLAVAVGLTGGSAWAARQANTADAPRAIAVAQIPVDVPVPLSPDSVEGSQAVDAAQAAAEAVAEAQAAEAAKATHHSSEGGPVRCPAGSSANSNDGVNDTSCFPDICFHIPIPDPSHPECDTAFKP